MRLVKITKINQYKIATFQWHLQFNWFSIWSNCFRFRSSRLEVFCKKSVLKNFAKFSGKHLSQILFFNEVAGLKPTILLKKRFWHGTFPVNFAKFLKTTEILLGFFCWKTVHFYDHCSESPKKKNNTIKKFQIFIEYSYWKTSERAFRIRRKAPRILQHSSWVSYCFLIVHLCNFTLRLTKKRHMEVQKNYNCK